MNCFTTDLFDACFLFSLTSLADQREGTWETQPSSWKGESHPARQLIPPASYTRI